MHRKKTVYISGSGHSGSTLLDMMLGGHGEISNLGEVHRITLSLDRSGEPFRCTCGDSVVVCKFWSKVLKEYRNIKGLPEDDDLSGHMTTHPSFLNIKLDAEDKDLEPNGENLYQFNLSKIAMVLNSKMLWKLLSVVSSDVKVVRESIGNSLVLYEAVREAWGTPTVIDSTKTPVRLKGLFYESGEEFHVLRLVRDGRAVCNSRRRRTGFSVKKCAEIWKSEQRKQSMVLAGIPDRFITFIRYEDLCKSHERELQRICQRLGLTYDAQMLDFRSNSIHSIGGNPMRFRQKEANIRLDEKWRTEMLESDLAIFEKIAGRVNRKLGYLH